MALQDIIRTLIVETPSKPGKTCDIVVATTGVSVLIKPEMVRPGQIILALSNPNPEITPEEALAAGVAFAVEGRLVNNALGFPGIFRGALNAGFNEITYPMLACCSGESNF